MQQVMGLLHVIDESGEARFSRDEAKEDCETGSVRGIAADKPKRSIRGLDI